MLNPAAVPMPSSMQRAVESVVVGKTTFDAALPTTPTMRPMKIWSVRLYNAPTSMLIIDGIAYFAMSGISDALPSSISEEAICFSLIFAYKLAVIISAMSFSVSGA